MNISIHWPIILFAALLLGMGACREKNSNGEPGEEFAQFYTRFHQDSAFQLAHINFPLKGMPDNALSKGIDPETFFWKREEWQIHLPIDFETSGFKRELASVGDGIVVERILHQSGDYAMLRRFAKLGDEWYLIYYAGLNPISKEE